MAEMTPLEQLEPHKWHFIAVREWKAGAPTEGSIVCTRLTEDKPDILGDPGSTCVELVTDTGRQLLPRPIVRHSPTGFEWGYHGSGPADLAANCLAVVLPLTEAWRLRQGYKRFAIAGLPQEGGNLSIRGMRMWVESQWMEERGNAAQMAQEASLRRHLAAMEKLTELEKRQEAGEEIPPEEWDEVAAMEQDIPTEP